MASMCLIRKICVRRNIAVPALGNAVSCPDATVTAFRVVMPNTVFKDMETTQEVAWPSDAD